MTEESSPPRYARPPMLPPRIPADEGERLMALHRLGILDTPPTESFDRITSLAAEALRVPILLVSLVDESRQWFKSCVGLDVAETSREISFCGHVVFERRPMVVCDATKDARFASNPLVVGAPHIRAYLGIPLFTLNEQPIGTLCAIDVKPREFSSHDVETLSKFAKIIEETLHAKELAAQTHSVLQLAQDREQLFRDTFEQSAVGIVHISTSGRVVRLNRRASDMLGYSEIELRALTIFDVTHPDDVAKNADLFQRMIAGELDTYRIEKRFLRKDGQPLWVYLSVALKRTDTGQPDYLIAVIEDLTDKKFMETALLRSRDVLEAEVTAQTKTLQDRNQALRAQINLALESEQRQQIAERRLRSIADNVPALIGYWDKDLKCVFANEQYQSYFGIPPEKIVGMTMRQLLGEAVFKLNEPFARSTLAGHPQQFERTLKKTDGTTAFTDARYIPDFDERGEVRGFYVLVTDITALRMTQAELQTANVELRRDSTTDYLTGIANRKVFTEQSEKAASRYRESGEMYGLVMIDVDNFKTLNDQYGHDIGDEVLRALGRVLKEQLRGRKDLAARLGGEEFAVLCFGDLHEKSLNDLAERIRRQVNRETIHTPEGLIRVTCSFGTALSLASDADWKYIYARADAALYQAKSSGKDRVVFGGTNIKESTGPFRGIRAVPNS